MANNRDHLEPTDENDGGDDYEVLESHPKIPATSVKPATNPVRPSAPIRPTSTVKGPTPQGGPVVRPTRVQKPGAGSRRSPTAEVLEGRQDGGDGYGQEPPYDANKGKITAQKAKLIWIACIAVSVLALTAFILDLALDVFGRRKGQGPVANTNTAKTNTTKTPVREKTAKEILAEKFVAAVGAEARQLRSSRAYDFYMLARNRFWEAFEDAKKIRGDDSTDTPTRERAYAEAYKLWYECKYAAYVYQLHFQIGFSDYIPIDVENFADVKSLDDAALQSKEIIRLQAADHITNYMMKKVNEAKKDMTQIPEARNILDSDEWKKKIWGEAEHKFKMAQQQPPVIAQEDLDFIAGPDYKPGEEMEYEKAMKARDADKGRRKDG